MGLSFGHNIRTRYVEVSLPPSCIVPRSIDRARGVAVHHLHEFQQLRLLHFCMEVLLVIDLPDVSPVDLHCLTEAIYHEARGESFTGQLLVGYVIRNRVESDKFPDSYCGVVYQPSQFSYTHELKDKTMHETKAAWFAEGVAEIIVSSDNPIPEAVYYYHTTSIMPSWNFDLLDQFQIVDQHVFYEEVI